MVFNEDREVIYLSSVEESGTKNYLYILESTNNGRQRKCTHDQHIPHLYSQVLLIRGSIWLAPDSYIS